MVARFNASEDDLAALRAVVKGEELDVSELASLSDVATMKKVFKCSEQELSVGSLLDSALCKFAGRDC